MVTVAPTILECSFNKKTIKKIPGALARVGGGGHILEPYASFAEPHIHESQKALLPRIQECKIDRNVTGVRGVLLLYS